MVCVERFRELNPMQRRVLRNWTPYERPAKLVKVLVPLPEGRPFDSVLATVARLVRKHENLRSRLARDDAGGLRQEVLDADFVLAGLPVLEYEAAERGRLGHTLSLLTPHPVDPELRSLHCTVATSGGRVFGVLLSIPHVFADGISHQLLYQELARPAESAGPPVRRSPGDAEVADNTAHWKDVLRHAPRFCTYSGAVRERWERMEWAQARLPDEDQAAISRTTRALGLTPYHLWTTAAHLLVGALTGQPETVLKTSVANRSAAADFGAVDQLANAVFIPIAGGAADTVDDRATRVFEAGLRGESHGYYDANGLLRWLDHDSIRSGAVFRPAFEINYGSAIWGARWPSMTGGPRRHVWEEVVRHDPGAAKADLELGVWHEHEATVVTLGARAPVWRARPAGRLLDDLLSVMRAMCRDPSRPAASLPVVPLAGPAGAIAGHRSGVAVDPTAMRRLLLLPDHVLDCSFGLMAGPRGGVMCATVRAGRPLDRDELLAEYARRQRWVDGTVVPDRLRVERVPR